MSDENNKQYVGEVYIDGKSDKLLQTFLTNLFNSYKGHGKGFDADMLDTWHLEDILTYTDEQSATKLNSITIGQSVFTVDDSSKFLQISDSIYNQFQNSNNAPWIEFLKARIMEDDSESNPYLVRQDSTGLSDEDNYLLNDILLDIYYTLDLDKVDTTVFDRLDTAHDELERLHNQLRTEFDTFTGNFSNVLEDVVITNDDGESITTKFINAQLINGFRIIPITQEKYDELPEQEKNYWRNIYIIRDSIPDDYSDPIAFSALQNIRIELNEEEGVLYYYNGISETPSPLCSLEDLLIGANFNQIINNFVTNTTNVVYNIDAIKETLKELVIEQDEIDTFPFLLRDESDILISDIVSDNGDITNEANENGFQTYDITHAFDNIFGADLGNETIAEQITDIKNNINNLTQVMTENDNAIEQRLTDSSQTYTQEYVSSNYTKTDVMNTLINQAKTSLYNELYPQILNIETSVDNLARQYYNNSLRISINREDDPITSEHKPVISVGNNLHSICAQIYCDDPNFSLENKSVCFIINGVYYERKTDVNGKSGSVAIRSLAKGSHTVVAIVRGSGDIKNAIDIRVLDVV